MRAVSPIERECSGADDSKCSDGCVVVLLTTRDPSDGKARFWVCSKCVAKYFQQTANADTSTQQLWGEKTHKQMNADGRKTCRMTATLSENGASLSPPSQKKGRRKKKGTRINNNNNNNNNKRSNQKLERKRSLFFYWLGGRTFLIFWGGAGRGDGRRSSDVFGVRPEGHWPKTGLRWKDVCTRI